MVGSGGRYTLRGELKRPPIYNLDTLLVLPFFKHRHAHQKAYKPTSLAVLQNKVEKAHQAAENTQHSTTRRTRQEPSVTSALRYWTTSGQLGSRMGARPSHVCRRVRHKHEHPKLTKTESIPLYTCFRLSSSSSMPMRTQTRPASVDSSHSI